MTTTPQAKKSIYNYLTEVDGRWLLYNTFSDEVCLLAPETKALYACEIDEIEERHPDFYHYLVHKGFLVAESVDEVVRCIDTWQQEDDDPRSFSLTINPTLDCNMRCWYCYEKHDATHTMSEQVIGQILRLIEKQMASPQLERFLLSFFGGEPLIQYRHVVKPLVDFAMTQAKTNQKALSLSFTTNGYLITPKIIAFFETLAVPIHFQITLDGNKLMHDATRYTAKGEGSYNRILENCAALLKLPHVSVALRCNYTAKNVATFMDLAADLQAHHLLPQAGLSINFHRVWQDTGDSIAVEEQLSNVKALLIQKGYMAVHDKGVRGARCYADRNNHILINYNGNLYHCTARDFEDDKAEGVLCEDGTLSFNERTDHRNALKWGNESCKSCGIYPLCHSRCSQTTLERMGEKGCFMGYAERDKARVMEERVRYIIEQSKKTALAVE